MHSAISLKKQIPSSRTPLTLIGLLSIALAAAGWSETPDKPNILFLFCDDLGYGDVGVFHQNERAAKNDRSVPYFTTPQLDAVADAGMMLNQHYCAAPVCAPSRASLLTGLTQGHAPLRDNQFDRELADTHTIGSVLKQAGYATAVIGKWGLQGNPTIPDPEGRKAIHPTGSKFQGWPSYPTERGFDYFLGYVRHRDGHYHYPLEDKKQLWENQMEISKNFDLCFSTDLFTTGAKRWIVNHQQEKPDQPFLLYLAYDTPHAKLQNPPCAYPEGGGLKGGVQWTGKAHAMLNTAKGKYDGWMHPDYANATWDHDKNPATAEVPWPEVQKRYANNVRRIDDTVGDLMQLLKDLKIDDNTLVVFSSDNGPSSESYIKKHPYQPTFFHGFGPFEGIKRDTLEGGLRVPTIARWPAKIKASTTSTQPSGHWDWLATFADAAGLTHPAASDGVSLIPALTGIGPHHPSALYSEYSVGGRTPKYPEFHPSHRGKVRNQMQVVFVDGYKGLRTDIKSADDDFEIYDVTKDPKELKNLADAKGFAEIQTRMKARALQCRIPLKSAARPYDDALIPALAPAPIARKGIGFGMYPLTTPWIPAVRNDMAIPNPSGTFDLKEIGFNLKDPAVVKVEAAIHIPADGLYTFTLNSNTYTMLFVHDIRLMDELKQANAKPRQVTLRLKKGWHPVQMLCRFIKPNPHATLEVSGPDGEKISLKPEDLRQTGNIKW
jgi:arylsulfatase A-like enzyme